MIANNVATNLVSYLSPMAKWKCITMCTVVCACGIAAAVATYIYTYRLYVLESYVFALKNEDQMAKDKSLAEAEQRQEKRQGELEKWEADLKSRESILQREDASLEMRQQRQLEAEAKFAAQQLEWAAMAKWLAAEQSALSNKKAQLVRQEDSNRSARYEHLLWFRDQQWRREREKEELERERKQLLRDKKNLEAERGD
ncbi:hypothetical protein ABW21_db0207859 [Orbilia brochopaga]|nr:hypothetical protein ABW21_db0207859 [Drechslerella brochopaga]